MIVKQTSPRSIRSSRRGFLKGAAVSVGALVVGTYVDFGGGFGRLARAATPKDGPMPNAFIRIAEDDSVTVILKHLDMGQGVSTGLSTIVAEELDADWAQIRVEFSPADGNLYNNLLFGPVQGTGGSTSIANSWDQLRKAGAAAKAMLMAAAAADWRVPAGEIAIAKGVIAHSASGRTSRFGAFAARAAAMPVPQTVAFKAEKDWIFVGKHVSRIDSVDKTAGKAIYAIDIKRPGMVTAMLVRSPRFGGVVKSIDSAAAQAVKGVVEIVRLPNAVAILAKDTWSAIKAREALKVEWDDAKAETRSTDAMFAHYRQLAGTAGRSAAKRGDAAGALAGAAKVVEAEYTFPYLAHAPMEPLNAVIERKPDGAVELWAGAQFQTIELMTTAAVLGVPPDKVKLNTVWAGGSFGRRATPNADYFLELASIAKAATTRTPIHLVWTREDDIKGGRYRPMSLHKVRAGVDAGGNLVAWEQRVASQSFAIGTPLEGMMVKDGVDHTAVEGCADTPYGIPNLAVDWHHVQSPVTVLWWRSVGHSYNAYVAETMMDALAHAAGKDPVEFRLGLLKEHPRHAAVLKLAAEKGGWGEKLPAGRGRGIALHESFQSRVAMVADVTTRNGVLVKVDRIVAAVDCGIAVNPDVVKAQVEGGVGYGLGAALRNKITFSGGVVDQSNFESYEPIRMSDMPVVEVHIVPSREPPTGIGEPGVPPVAPAVANALFAATGKRHHSLPWA